MLKSKRFLYSCAAFAAYLIGVFIFKLNPIEYATGITILLTPYLAAQTFRGSNTQSK
jgi:hypothetical protein